MAEWPAQRRSRAWGRGGLEVRTMSVADKRKARFVELNTLHRPLTEKEEAELRFLEK